MGETERQEETQEDRGRHRRQDTEGRRETKGGVTEGQLGTQKEET